MNRELRSLGLTSYETKIYRCLLEYGKLNARGIAQHSGVPPTAVYPNLKTLVERGLIQQLHGEVSLFQALAPSLALPSFVEREKKKLTALQETIVEQGEKLLQSKQIIKEREVLHLSYGKEFSSAIYFDALERVQKTFYILGWLFLKVGNKYEFLQKFKKALRRGVDIRILLTGPPDKNWELLKTYQEAGIKTRYLPLNNFSILVVDGKECKITLKDRKLPEKINLHILDESLARAMHTYYLDQWDKAEELHPEKYLKYTKGN
ncbi:MAG TPA: helix-turn-helix domain-containing protein [Candidatus Nanoarchaeia archaeon]|nr:helix-turn-helix domain-containing protein [Candidatus Nanoarchaeia archaeon]